MLDTPSLDLAVEHYMREVQRNAVPVINRLIAEYADTPPIQEEEKTHG